MLWKSSSFVLHIFFSVFKGHQQFPGNISSVVAKFISLCEGCHKNKTNFLLSLYYYTLRIAQYKNIIISTKKRRDYWTNPELWWYMFQLVNNRIQVFKFCTMKIHRMCSIILIIPFDFNNTNFIFTFDIFTLIPENWFMLFWPNSSFYQRVILLSEGHLTLNVIDTLYSINMF